MRIEPVHVSTVSKDRSDMEEAEDEEEEDQSEKEGGEDPDMEDSVDDEVESRAKTISRNVTPVAAPACETEDSDDRSDSSDSEEDSDSGISGTDRIGTEASVAQQLSEQDSDTDESGEGKKSHENTDSDEPSEDGSDSDESDENDEDDEDTDMDGSNEDSSDSNESEEEEDDDFAIADITNREFDTSKYDNYATNQRVYHESPAGPWYLVRCTRRNACCGYRSVHLGSMVIAVDGSCWHNASTGARAACGVFFHPRNKRYNCNFLLPGRRQTSMRAELAAALKALRVASAIRDKNPARSCAQLRRLGKLHVGACGPETKLSQVVIKTDCKTLVEAMTGHIHRWKKNGFVNRRRCPITDADLYRPIDDEVTSLNRRGVRVQFWFVRGHKDFGNHVADFLAKSRLWGGGAAKAMKIWNKYNKEYWC